MNIEELNYQIDSFTKWFMFDGFNIEKPEDLQNTLIEKLNNINFEIVRCHMVLTVLHPQVGAEVYRWYKKDVFLDIGAKNEITDLILKDYESGKVEIVKLSHKVRSYDVYKNSPLFPVIENGDVVRHKFNKGDTDFKFPILKELFELNATDYLILPLHFNFYNKRSAITWVSNKKNGFDDNQIKLLESISDILALYLKSYLDKQITSTLLETYLGKSTGSKVLKGQILRGDIQKIDAAIWFSDLRGFSAISNQYETNILIDWLNEYFDLIADSIDKNNGEILKYIGDAVLAIFPLTDDKTKNNVCYQALSAAKLVNKKLLELNKKRENMNLPKLKHGIGLHYGTVEYGNIGASKRLDFTVMGPTVNLASRIESLCGKLSKETLTSELFANLCPTIQYLGDYQLKGFEDKQKIYIVN